MAMRLTCCALPLLLAAHAAAQTALYGVRANGDLLHINRLTGAAATVGSSGVECRSASPFVYDHGGRTGITIEDILLGGGPGAQADQITTLHRWTGAVVRSLNTSGRPAGYGIHAMAAQVFPSSTLYVILSTEEATTIDLLATIDLNTGVYTVVGPTGRTDLTALALSPSSVLYALGTGGGGTLCTVDKTSGAALTVGGGGFGGDDRALQFLPDGRLLACGANLRFVNPATGATTLVGPTGFTDIHGLAAITTCYADCDHGGPPPMLNVTDLTCFLQRFAAGDPWANCDISTTPPVLNVNDFVCFQQAFAGAAGCW